MKREKQRYFMTSSDVSVPFYIESIGWNPEQEAIERKEGYPCVHWIQTVSGEGVFHLEGRSMLLPPQHGILFLPNRPHRYRASSRRWSTYYMTFAGPQAGGTVSALGLQHGHVYQWEDAVLDRALEGILRSVMSQDRPFTSLDGSMEVYRFLVLLKKHGKIDQHPSIHSLMERMRPLLRWLEKRYADPNLGVTEMAAVMGMSARHLNTLFQQAFGYTPYHYLLRLRLRQAKERLLQDGDATVKEVAKRVGFREASHFIATFRRLEGLTPQQFRKLHKF